MSLFWFVPLFVLEGLAAYVISPFIMLSLGEEPLLRLLPLSEIAAETKVLLRHIGPLAPLYGLCRFIGLLWPLVVVAGLPLCLLGVVNRPVALLFVPAGFALYAFAQSHVLERYWYLPLTWRTHRLGDRAYRLRSITGEQMSGAWYPLTLVDAATGKWYGHLTVIGGSGWTKYGWTTGWMATVRRKGDDPVSERNGARASFETLDEAVAALVNPDDRFKR